MRRAFLYARVSSFDQNPQTQLLDIRRLAEQLGFEIVREYTDKISGAKAKRPALDQMLAAAHRRECDVVLVWAADRLARSVRHFLEVLDTLNHLGIEFVSFRENLEYSILASKRNPLDPMEIAFQEFGSRSLSNTEHLHHDWALIHEYPLSPALLSMSRVWSPTAGHGFVVAAKGAPEAIVELCRLSPDGLDEIATRASDMASEGLRVLGVAKSKWEQSPLPESQRELTFEFIGLVGLADPIRPEVPVAVDECYRAGIQVIMITGDYSGTAQNIAKQVGISAADQVLTGLEVGLMGDTELRERVGSTNVFARMVPEQKLRLVNVALRVSTATPFQRC